jgi:hypothetical protein
MRFPTVLFFMVFLVLASVPLQAAGDDPIHQKCLRQTEEPPPWCYQREVERIGDPALCENILVHWPKADGVHGQCYYQLALKHRNCRLCSRIRDTAIRRMCTLDACPSPQKVRN